MTLPERIQLIDDLIRENSDATIKDYLSVLYEIELVEKTENTEEMAKYLTFRQKLRVVMMGATMTPAEIRQETGIAYSTIYEILTNAEVDFREVTKRRRHQKIAERKEALRLEKEQAAVNKHFVPTDLLPDVKKPFVRPPAEYSNHSPFGIAS